MSTHSPTQPIVPLYEGAIDEILALIPHMLKDDEAGPPFFLITNEWAFAHNYPEGTDNV